MISYDSDDILVVAPPDFAADNLSRKALELTQETKAMAPTRPTLPPHRRGMRSSPSPSALR